MKKVFVTTKENRDSCVSHEKRDEMGEESQPVDISASNLPFESELN